MWYCKICFNMYRADAQRLKCIFLSVLKVGTENDNNNNIIMMIKIIN